MSRAPTRAAWPCHLGPAQDAAVACTSLPKCPAARIYPPDPCMQWLWPLGRQTCCAIARLSEAVCSLLLLLAACSSASGACCAWLLYPTHCPTRPCSSPPDTLPMSQSASHEAKQALLFNISGGIGTAIFYVVFLGIEYQCKALDISAASTVAWVLSYLLSILWQYELHAALVFGRPAAYWKSLAGCYVAYGVRAVLAASCLQHVPQRRALPYPAPLTSTSHRCTLGPCHRLVSR